MIKIENVIKLNKNHINRVGEVLGRALAEDPVSLQAFPEKNERHENIKYVFRMASCIGMRYGEIYASSEKLEGIAIWIHSQGNFKKRWGNLICAIKAKVWNMGFQASRLINPIMEYNKEMHNKHAPGKHLYLQTLGVDPKHQYRGIGSVLVNHMIEKNRENALPIYLETSTERNVGFYKRLGFKVIDEGIVPETAVKQWYLLKEY
ncbi:MAG: GNAT family N-acetyltransferase [Candidatus Lokiarchaeota archaeon]|nr:GNAT family N-acetyltransferase [Candidatus Lokiarchaeota archaeon]MBD3201608.1 GNAT family N-acetyltransferase [Candidatus Lokiarchaeota archaeon]